ncbi:MAG: NADP-dependent isocitrate dehydrogenase [Cytophagia bacterium]|nr:MAG: NADP-dependent isocitrate dehydrogenase [Cytophagales bacterium]TAG06396.1 MAG: NADP-dependent isocitrate dehydrogenase [Cytophagia bacterium]TAG39221.1 MAG: NADP-dependent isocitrate dehydrogenase [Cytophagia bacterium]TAH30809.1 MAG: NADP-dependent isocitrate dehydrogenase [Cytophagales bacterium]
MAEQLTPITVAYGDGIGPEIMDATLRIITAAGARIKTEVIEIGEKVYLSGNSAGIAPEAWESLRRTKVFLKAPITTPQGGGYKSLNVTTRKMLGLFANIRPCVSYHPYVDTKHPIMDVIIIRENEEDLYAGIEHQQTPEVIQCLKLITRPGTEKIVRYAFEYAKQYGRKKVTCFAKDNIMKQTDGLFHKVFDEIGAEYPELEKEFWIVDIGAAKLADSPEVFDVIVMPNLYGDILSDVAAQIAGSVGLAGSANIGAEVAMFEAIHGSAPRRANQNLANPSGLLLGAVQMLVHIGQGDIADKVHNAWLKALEDGVHTYDIFKEGVSKEKVGTKEFADAVIARMGQKPANLKHVDYSQAKEAIKVTLKPAVPTKMETIGVDVFLYCEDRNANKLGDALKVIEVNGLHLTMITNRGVKVYPDGMSETFCTDHWRCRYKSDKAVSYDDILALQTAVNKAGFAIIKTENLCKFDGVDGFSGGQGA